MAETGTPVTCSNCGSAQVRVYCAECGERQPTQRDFAATALIAEAASEFAGVDGRLWRSVVALLSKPGFLAQEYFAGRRKRFMRPFSLFVMLNVVFFFVQPYTGLFRYSYAGYVDTDGFAARTEARRAELGQSRQTFERRFNDALADQKRSILLVAIPVFALVLWLLFVRSSHTFVEHMVFAVHSYAFMVFYLLAIATVGFSVIFAVASLVNVPREFMVLLNSEMVLMLVIGGGMILYLQAGLRRYYGSGRVASLARAVMLFSVQGLLIATFRVLLFHTVLFSL